jgi:EAL domain-containing protein (putative c-di-GMP-specific phosphodiesterase class I)
LSVPVCVEGIENKDVYTAVVGLGGSIGQGWYFGKPMTGDQAASMLRSRNSKAVDAPADAASRRRTA